MGQFLRNSVFLQAFYEGRDRGGLFGKSRLISSAYVLSMMWKTSESTKSLSPFVAGRRRVTGARGGFLQRASWHQRGAATARRGVTPARVCMPPTCDTLSDVLMVSPLGVSCCSPQKGSALYVMLALRRRSRQIVMTDEELHGPDMVGELLGKGQRCAGQPGHALPQR